jgi:putative OmpL-like beta-barrel porin-2
VAACPARASGERPAETPPAVSPSPWTLRGYAELAYTWNFNEPRNAPPADRPAKENSFRIYDTLANEFTLHSVLLDASKAATEDSWVGFQAVALAGQDAKWIHAAGLFDDGTGGLSGDGSDFDLVDAYLTVLVPRSVLPAATRVKVGKWETNFGYEVLQAAQNQNYSHSYLLGFAIPVTHTGIIADTEWVKRGEGGGELLGTGLGVVNGWDNVKDNNDAKSIMTQLRFQPCDQFETHAEVLLGPEQANDNSNWRGLVDVNATVNGWGFLESLSVSGNYDYGWESGVDVHRIAGGDFHAGDSTWYGFAGYAKYRFRSGWREPWYLSFRGEWFNDPDGARTGMFLPAGVEPGVDYIELTATLGYRPVDSLLIRLEYRHDQASEAVYAKGDGFRGYLNTVAVDVVVGF